MESKRNATSFTAGHKRSKESIERQRATIRKRMEEGEWHLSKMLAAPITPAVLAARAATRRANSVGNTRIHTVRGIQYRVVMTPEGRMYEHRAVMEAAVGRKLKRTEHVHHKDGDTLNNSLDNLELLRNGDHTKRHHDGVVPSAAIDAIRLNGKWSRSYGDRCVECGSDQRKHDSRGLCTACHQKRLRSARHHHCPKT